MHKSTDTIDVRASKDPLRQPKVTLQALYRRHGEMSHKQSTRRGLWAAVFVYLVFSISDIMLLGDVARYTVATRFAISIVMLIALEVQMRRPSTADAIDITAAGALVLAYAGWLATSVYTENTSAMSYYMVFGAIFMMSVNLFFNFPFRISVVASVVIVAIFLTGLAWFPHTDSSYKFTFGLFCISCFIFTSYVNWKLNQERYNVFLNALEAKAQHRQAAERGEALLRLSHTDPLTGLANRRAIDNHLRDLWRDWKQTSRPFAAILVDVDFFKRYNDFYGHLEGDRCLVLVSQALRILAEQRRAIVGRFGGEEFILLAHAQNEQDIADLCEAIRLTVEDLDLVHEQRRDGTSRVTVSVGAAFTADPSLEKVEKIIHRADRALYSAKAAGRNCIRLYNVNDPLNSDDSENIAALLKIAVPQGLVSMVYQPLKDVVSGKIHAYEALMRLRMPDGAYLSPSLFIPAAERSGAIIGLGQWALRRVCEELLVSGLAQVASVNVSPLQLKTPGFAAFVAATLSELGLSGDRLALEITEGQDMEIHSSLLRCISDLKNLGVKIWLDDFGTGFAGLSWLRLIDFDCVKIDKSFLHDCNTRRGCAMLDDILRLARNRGATILVEGVETDEHLALMHRMKIDLMQGYHVGRPAPATTIVPASPSRSLAVVSG
jgi:diguanylate cyclase (GGDEF)-like protein